MWDLPVAPSQALSSRTAHGLQEKLGSAFVRMQSSGKQRQRLTRMSLLVLEKEVPQSEG